MKKRKIMIVFGTRPEAIKMAPLILALKKNVDFEVIVTVTAQHRQMLDQVLATFSISPDFDLDIMKDQQTLSEITSNVIQQLDCVLKSVKPELILVHGDTTTTLAASLAAFYNQVKIGHVEAGLRTYDKYSPFPEEMNRQLTDSLSDIYFAPTKESRQNLLNEAHDESAIHITGNTAIDALKYTITDTYEHPVLHKIPLEDRFVLLTMHRRENQGSPMEEVFKAITEVINADIHTHIIFPVHLNPIVQKSAHELLGNHPRIHLISPLDVFDFHNMAARSYFIMSDSGGVQEEAPSLGKPVLVLRETTERPEGVLAGTLKLIGTEKETVQNAMLDLLTDRVLYEQMSKASNPYGDGNASAKIIAALIKMS
ncbi:UDP-N-acetylglucosamine 2-epimerase [Brochothrix thermosphacta]|uniref:non-hydrolyzing UDP-N-acetylglucosamine 2-epimerase n=1 Tax=Brochothrix thermosphacta TaxID=2756 RepID=UPI00083FB6FA|nr:UDP-N-acetylglucosamine 2-epimerase (non-hydrolyzing) [Brochothrix thermosphacta]ODJ56541.1 UDP-N-acetylglucosamine 2-epimerase [Brochothrix thermosphacta]ODJ57979.1 UDP-N-acetylglucosamine 2-epimerase [Brochothrix thermosphacta]